MSTRLWLRRGNHSGHVTAPACVEYVVPAEHMDLKDCVWRTGFLHTALRGEFCRCDCVKRENGTARGWLGAGHDKILF